METQNIAVEQYPDVDILGFNQRLQWIEAVEEDGGMDIFFSYDIHREWVEESEGGYITASYYEYIPVNIKIDSIIHEHLGKLASSYLNENTIEYLTKYIHDEIYNEANGIQ